MIVPQAKQESSHLAEMLIFPIDLLDDLVVAVKDPLREAFDLQLPMIEVIVGAAFTVLCVMIAVTTAKELYNDLKKREALEEIEDEEAIAARRRRIAKNIPKLLLALGGTALGLSMIIGGLGHVLHLAGIAVAGASFFPFAIMATMTVASAVSLAKSVADFRVAKKAYDAKGPYNRKIEEDYIAKRNKVIFDAIDLAACATITTCLGIMAFGVLAGISIGGLGIPLIIIIAVAAIAIIAKIIEHKEVFIKVGHDIKQGCNKLGNKIQSGCSKLSDNVSTLFAKKNNPIEQIVEPNPNQANDGNPQANASNVLNNA